MNLSPSEINAEFEYRVAERVGILTQGNPEPTKWEFQMARQDAFEAIERIKNETEN